MNEQGGGDSQQQQFAVTALPASDLFGAASRLCEQLDAHELAFGQGTSSAADEAVWIAMHVAGYPAGTESFEAHAAEPVSQQQWQAMQAIAWQRCEQRLPLAQILGEAWFAGLRFEVTGDVLVPRSPIAELVMDGFQPWLPAGASQALDLCTGSGCLAIAMAHWMPELAVHASDLSGAALAVAERNRHLHQLEQRLTLFHGDLFEPLHGNRYDLIVSNPPYVGQQEYNTLPTEFSFEPAMGLVAEHQGMALVLRLLHQAPDHMTEQAVLICEVGFSRPQLEQMLPHTPFTWLEFEHGGEGVFLLDRNTLLAQRPTLARAMAGE